MAVRRVVAVWCAVLLAALLPVAAALAAGSAKKAAASATATVATGAASASAATSTAPIQLPGTTNPFSPGVPVSPATTPSTTAQLTSTGGTTTGGDSGLTGTGALLVVIGAAVILGGIAFFIWRDARRHAPAIAGSHAHVEEGTGHKAGSKKPAKPRKLSAAEAKRRKRGRAPRRK